MSNSEYSNSGDQNSASNGHTSMQMPQDMHSAKSMAKRSSMFRVRARARTRNILDRFAIDFALCMYCGICIEVCPFDALHWSPEFEYATTDIRNLTHGKAELREWLWTVPVPTAIEPGRTETDS